MVTVENPYDDKHKCECEFHIIKEKSKYYVEKIRFKISYESLLEWKNNNKMFIDGV